MHLALPRSFEKFRSFVLVVGWLALGATPMVAADANATLLRAAEGGDAPQIILALAEVAPDIRDADGRTPLMLAAKSGSFEAIKRLLWAGANPLLKDHQGRSALDCLLPEADSYAPNLLIIRAYIFCRENSRYSELARLTSRATTPHLTVINDLWVDPIHPKISSLYQINQAELKGVPGVDEDKNGFVDDVYGWNLMNDEPLRAPQLAIDQSAESGVDLGELMSEYLNALNNGDGDREALMRQRYTNPLVKQIGLGVLIAGEVELNDWVYASMLYDASHGTHVAGIVAEASDGKALLQGAAIGLASQKAPTGIRDINVLVGLASSSPTFGDYIVKVIQTHRAGAIAKGRRSSDFLRATGTGVANMSWHRPPESFRGLAQLVHLAYEQYGGDPATMETISDPSAAELAANLELELKVADAAAFALAFYENPDVLFCISANNQSLDNDVSLSSPAYLSRFMPNVITVASVSDQNTLSGFSNYGVRSVQIAAPGEKVHSALLGNLEGPMTGTSMATPKVAGVAAAIRHDFPNLTASEVRQVLESSSLRTESLVDQVSTSGILDPGNALQLAKDWSGNNLAVLLDDANRAIRPGPDGPRLVTPKAAEELPTIGKTPYRIHAVSGNGSHWSVAMATGTGFTEQLHLGVGPWPGANVESHWEQGYRITSLSGVPDQWNIVMSKGVAGTQAVFGYELDQSRIAKEMEDGRRITQIAGTGDQWLVVMDTETGWGAQRYSLPTALTDSRKQWVKDRWAENYRITAIAGDDDPAIENDGWLFVLTKGTSYTDQSFTGPGPWPRDWVQANLDAGFRVTSMAGGGDRIVVVMSKGSPLDQQSVSSSNGFPDQWIKENW